MARRLDTFYIQSIFCALGSETGNLSKTVAELTTPGVDLKNPRLIKQAAKTLGRTVGAIHAFADTLEEMTEGELDFNFDEVAEEAAELCYKNIKNNLHKPVDTEKDSTGD